MEINMIKFMKKGEENGFTLIEILVSTFIFSIIVIVIGNAFSHTLRMQRRALVTQDIQENLVFVTEMITREARVSNICPVSLSSCTQGDLYMKHKIYGDIHYYLSGNQIYRDILNDSEPPSILTSSDIQIDRLNFYRIGVDYDDNLQPRVTIVLRAKGGSIAEKVEINTQITASQRYISD